MPSASLLHWQTDRMPRLAAVDAHCVATAVLASPDPVLAEESLRAYVMLLSGHFQGFCRDLYTECAQVCAAAVPISLFATVQTQFVTALRLDSSNPNVETLRRDFERFAITLNFDAEPANALRVTHLGHLNRWRNTVAHQAANAPAGVPPLTLAAVQGWRVSCADLATWLDGIMYNELQRILGTVPW